MCGSSSSSGTQSQVQTQHSTTQFDPWVTSASQDLFGSAQNWLKNNGYKSYSGPVTAEFGPTFDQASSYLSNLLGKDNPYTTEAAGATRSVMGAINPNATIQDYMSPYTASVLRPQLESIVQQSGQQGQAADAAATMAGAYGGTGAGIARALLAKNTQKQIADTTGAGYDAAFKNAQQSRLSNLSTLLQGGGQMSQIGQQQFGQNTTLASLLAGLGSQKQQAGDKSIDRLISLNKQDNLGPLSQWSMLAQILGGVPKNSTTDSIGTSMGTSSQSAPNNTGMGMLGSILGMFL